MTATSTTPGVGAAAATPSAGVPVLLYDGSCGLCARSVQFVLNNEHGSRVLRFATLQGRHGAAALAATPALEGVDSVIWLQPLPNGQAPRVLVRSDAVLAVMRHLGGPWTWLARLGGLVPRMSRDALYRIVARYRYRVFGKEQACLLPTPEQRTRFID